MKRIFFLVLLMNFSVFISCNNDDDNGNESVSIVGKWKIIDFQENGYTLDACEMMEQREYKTDNTIIKTYFYGNNCQNSGTSNWTYSISDNKLFTKEPNGGLNPNKDYIINYNIISLTNTKLIIEGYFVDEGVNGVTPTEIPQNERFTETWEKIN